MVASQKLYPRATIKKIVKAHSKKNVSRDVDVLVSSQQTCWSAARLIHLVDFLGLHTLSTDVWAKYLDRDLRLVLILCCKIIKGSKY